MPESSIAIFAAATEPAPAKSVYKLDMSVNTPILITPSEICACAVPTMPARARASRLRLNSFMLPPLVGEFHRATSDAQILVQLVHVRVQRGIWDHVHDPAALHHVVPVGDG